MQPRSFTIASLFLSSLVTSGCFGHAGLSSQASTEPASGASAAGNETTGGADVGLATKRNPKLSTGALPGNMVWLAPVSCGNLVPDHNPAGLAALEHAGHSNVDKLLEANLCAEVPRVARGTANDLDQHWHAGPNLTDAIARFCFRQIKGSPGSVVAAVRDALGPGYTVVVFDKEGAVLYIDRKFQNGATPPSDDELRKMLDSVPAAGPA